MKHFGSLLEALSSLKKKGFNTEFYLKKDGLWNSATKMFHPFKDAKILQTLKIEAQSDPDYISCVYALELKDGTKGVFIDATGGYSELEFIKLKK